MKITIESTTRTVRIKENFQSPIAPSINCRIWEGVTEKGIRVQVLIPRITPSAKQDLRGYKEELLDHKEPSADARELPCKIIL